MSWEKVTQLTRKGFKEEYVDLGPQFGRVNTPQFVFLTLHSVNEQQRRFKAHLLLVHEHDEGRCGPHGVSRSQLVSSPHLDIDLDKSDKAGPHTTGFLLRNFFEGRFDETTRSTRGRRKERNNGTV